MKLAKGARGDGGGHVKDAQKFLTRLQLRKVSDEEFGISWLEFYILYKAMG